MSMPVGNLRFAHVKQAGRERRCTRYFVPRAWIAGENVFCSSEQFYRCQEWRYYPRKAYMKTRLRQLGVDVNVDGEPKDKDFVPDPRLAPPVEPPKDMDDKNDSVKEKAVLRSSEHPVSNRPPPPLPKQPPPIFTLGDAIKLKHGW